MQSELFETISSFYKIKNPEKIQGFFVVSVAKGGFEPPTFGL